MKAAVIRLLLVVMLLAVVATPAIVADGGSTASSGGAPSAPSMSPEQLAVSFYNQALRKRDKAWQLEQKAGSLPESKRAKNEAKIESLFEQAINKLETAVEKNPRFFQAHGSLGYALRRLGRYEEALGSYDTALALNPNYPEAIEYRGEAYLGMDRIDEAREAYVQLASISTRHGIQLLDAMSEWIEARQEQPRGLEADLLNKVALWVDHQRGVAVTTSSAGTGGHWK